MSFLFLLHNRMPSVFTPGCAHNQRWHWALALIAGVCGVVAVGSISSLLLASPRTTVLHAAPAMAVTTAGLRTPLVHSHGPARYIAVLGAAAVQPPNQMPSVPDEVQYLPEARASASSWAPFVSVLAIPAAALAFWLGKRDAMRSAAVGVGAAALISAAPACAADVAVQMGTKSKLAFAPSTVTINAGDTVTWTLAHAKPHNIVFDPEAVPDGVSAEALSHKTYMNAKGESVSTTFDIPGTYSYYCLPHKSAGMKGTVIVQ